MNSVSYETQVCEAVEHDLFMIVDEEGNIREVTGDDPEVWQQG